MAPILALKKLLSDPQKIALIIHQRADGDALGSGLALKAFLQKKGHQVTLISPDTPPNFLSWLPGLEEILCCDQEADCIEATNAIKEASLIFCADFPALHRAGILSPLIKASKVPKIAIDHHPNSELFADVMWIDTEACATAALVYRMIVALEGTNLIDSSMATSLYLGILTDTGNYQHTNTNAEAHTTSGALIEKGADLPTIRHYMSPKQSLDKTRFFSYMCLKRLVVMADYQATYFLLSHKDYLKFNLESGDTSGLVGKALEIEGISLAILLVEKKDRIHLSFRSTEPIPVNILAQKYFSGGGHRHASGGFHPASLKETEAYLRDMITKEVPQYLLQK